MSSKTRSRLTELLIAVAVIAAALIWAERTAWQQIRQLRTEMDVRQIERFRSADRLRAAILQLQVLWRRGLDDIHSTSQTELETRIRSLGDLVGAQVSHPGSPEERKLVDRIRVTFDECAGHVAETLQDARSFAEDQPARTMRSDREKDFEQLLRLTEELTVVNRSAAERFMTDAHAGLARLQRFLFLAMVGLLICGTIAIGLIYRRAITPLQDTLTENRVTMERQEKLASLGVFATGIAHEIRNPLTAIKVHLFSLKANHRPGTSDHEDLEVIESEIDRLERIVRDFLQFARPSDPELRKISSAKLLQDTADLLAGELAKRSVLLKLELNANERVQVDAGKMKQVLINFVQNAADSMKAGGTITLRSRLDKQALNGRATTTTVVLDIGDTGAGISPEVQKRLFDPFFTTKEEGTGLGLAIAARIVEKHGGIIQYETQPNQGTTFSIVLPLAPDDGDKS